MIDTSIPCRTAGCVLPRNHSGEHCTQAEANEIAAKASARHDMIQAERHRDRQAYIRAKCRLEATDPHDDSAIDRAEYRQGARR